MKRFTAIIEKIHGGIYISQTQKQKNLISFCNYRLVKLGNIFNIFIFKRESIVNSLLFFFDEDLHTHCFNEHQFFSVDFLVKCIMTAGMKIVFEKKQQHKYTVFHYIIQTSRFTTLFYSWTWQIDCCCFFLLHPGSTQFHHIHE